jgi:hypothetical protein
MAGDMLVELEAFGLIALTDRFNEQAPRLHHPQRSQPVEHGEGLLADDLLQRVALSFDAFRHCRGLVVRQDLAQHPCVVEPAIVEMAQRGDVSHLAALGIKAVVPLQLALKLEGQQIPGVADEALEPVAGRLIERHR